MTENEYVGKAYASLVLLGKDLDALEVTDLIGIKPTRSFKRGDIRTGDKTWPHGFWKLESSERVQSLELSSHLEWLAAQLEPSKHELLQIIQQDGIDAHISCLWLLPSNHEVLSLSSEMVLRMANLGLEIEIDIYMALIGDM